MARARSTKAAVYLRIYTELCRVAKLNASTSTYVYSLDLEEGMALYISVPYRGVAPESIHAVAMLVAIRIRLLSGRLRPAGSVGDLKQVVVRDIYNRFGSRLSCKKMFVPVCQLQALLFSMFILVR